MTTGIIKENSIIAACSEAVEGTADTPDNATDGYFQPETDGILNAVQTKVEMKERNVLTSGLIEAVPRPGHYYPEGTVLVEVRGGTLEGAKPDYGILIQSLLGALHQVTANVTSESSGNTNTVLQIPGADISKFAVGDMLRINETGAHQIVFVTAVDSTGGTENITVTPGKTGGTAWSNSVTISKSSTYKSANTGHPSFTMNKYSANEILKQGLGCRTKSMSLDNYIAGEIAKLNFGYDGMTHAVSNAAAGYTPTYTTNLPPIIFNSKVYVDGTAVSVAEVKLQIEQPLTFLKSTASASGRTAGKPTGKLKISGSFSLAMDDTTFTQYTALMAGTEFALILTAHNPHASTTGAFADGSAFGIYLPKCIRTELSEAEEGGILVDAMNFKATGSTNGATNPIAIGFA